MTKQERPWHHDQRWSQFVGVVPCSAKTKTKTKTKKRGHGTTINDGVSLLELFLVPLQQKVLKILGSKGWIV